MMRHVASNMRQACASSGESTPPEAAARALPPPGPPGRRSPRNHPRNRHPRDRSPLVPPPSPLRRRRRPRVARAPTDFPRTATRITPGARGRSTRRRPLRVFRRRPRGPRVRGARRTRRRTRDDGRRQAPSNPPRSAAAAMTAMEVSTADAPPCVRSTACAWSARNIRNVNSRSVGFASRVAPLVLPDSRSRDRPRAPGTSHSCHPACSRSACALAGAPSTSLSKSSSTPSRICASGHFSSRRRRSPAAAAWTIPGTPLDDASASGRRSAPPNSDPVVVAAAAPPPPMNRAALEAAAEATLDAARYRRLRAAFERFAFARVAIRRGAGRAGRVDRPGRARRAPREYPA